MSAKKKTNPLLDAATTAALAQYGPQLQQAAALRASRLSDYMGETSQAKAAAQIIAAGAHQAQGGLADFLKRAGASQVHGPSSSESQIVAQNLGLTAQGAGAGLANIIARAPQAAAYQQQAARKSYTSDVAAIDAQKTQLESQYGNAITNEYNKLYDAANTAQQKAREASASRKNQRLIAGVDTSGKLTPNSPQAARITASNNKAAAVAKEKEAKQKKANAGRLPGGVKPASTSAFTNFQRDYEAGKRIAGILAPKIKSGKVSASTAISVIVNGLPKTDTDPGLIGNKNDVAAQAALDQILLNGRVSTTTAKKLHAAGITAKKIGVAGIIPDSTAAAALAAYAVAGVAGGIIAPPDPKK